MIELKNIPSTKEDLDCYEVENNFQSWSFQPERSPRRLFISLEAADAHTV